MICKRKINKIKIQHTINIDISQEEPGRVVEV